MTFLVAAAGLALVVLRDELTSNRPPERLALTVGFLATALAAFGRGSLLLKGDLVAFVIGLRAAGIVGLAIGSIWWWKGRGVARQALWVGLAGMTVADILLVIGAGRASNAALAVASISIGAALLTASRRSVAGQVAASAAGTLLLVVLVLSVALSAVLSSSVQKEELKRLQSRALIEANLAVKSDETQVPTARLAGIFLYDSLSATSEGLTAGEVNNLLAVLTDVYPVGLEFVFPNGQIVGEAGLDQVTATQLAGEPLVRQVTCASSTGSVYVVNSRFQSVGAYALCASTNPPTVLGVLLAVSPLDNSYLLSRNSDDSTISLAIVSQNAVLARAGTDLPSTKNLVAIGSEVVGNSLKISRVIGSTYISAYPITPSTGIPAGAIIVSTPTSAVLSTRDQLFQTLFLIALGGTLVALGLAVVIGDRITARLRRLTVAAESIRRGTRGERSGIEGDDEIGVLGSAFDSMAVSIEEQTRALREAADDETRLRNRLEAVVAGMGDSLVAVDSFGNITDFNQAAEELTGIAAVSAIRQPVDMVVNLVNEDGASLGPRLRTPSPTRWGMLATAVRRDGAEIPVAVSAGALRGPGNEVAGQVLVLRDLRREREVERMKTEFLSRVGHELRTPLTGIMGYAEFLLRRTVAAERAQVCYDEILTSAKRLLRVVEMLEFFASSGAGRVLLRPEPLDVRQLIEVVVTPWMEREPGAINRRVAKRVPEVNGDKRWLALALDELIDNAVKFSPGGPHVMVTAGLATARAGTDNRLTGPTTGGSPTAEPPPLVPVVEIAVVDRGKGMTPEEQATAFSEFVQGDSSDTRQFGGLGLGLSLVQRVVEGHGGMVKCTSLPGRGSTFTIVLPVPPDTVHDLDVEPPASEVESRRSSSRTPIA
ncbi:MAG: ATP-binding protein [Acidimicrobiales bacterium]